MKHLLPLGVPIVASLAAFILILLALLAGSSPGHMQNYDVLTLNTSQLGRNLVNQVLEDEQPTQTSSGFCDGLGDFLSDECASATAAAGSLKTDIVDAINDIGNDVADRLADTLGIHELYNLHALTICEGDYSPSPTAEDAKLNMTRCFNGLSGGFNISEIIDKELRLGPLQLTLADIGFTEDIQNTMDMINKILKAFAIILIVTTVLTGISFLASLISLGLITRRERGVLLTNVVLSGIAMGMLIISGLLVTIGAHIGADKANEMGADIGLSAKPGTNYTIITWVAVGLMIITFIFWLRQWLKFKNGKHSIAGSRKTYPKRDPRDSVESGYTDSRGTYNMNGVRFSRSRRG